MNAVPTFGPRPVVSKTEYMKIVREGLAHECFQHSICGRFDVTRMRAGLKDRTIPAMLIHVALKDILGCLHKDRVHDDARPMELSDESWKEDPGIVVLIHEPDGGISHLIIDGTHRALRREMEGEHDMAFYFVDEGHAIRPAEGFVENPFLDWGDELIDGKIVKRQ